MSILESERTLTDEELWDARRVILRTHGWRQVLYFPKGEGWCPANFQTGGTFSLREACSALAIFVCNQESCAQPAVLQYRWVSEELCRTCEAHAEWAGQVAKALGFTLYIEKIP